ncbi:hypothetical protein BpHYR1_016655, partial [Brachionus plicatilis]
QNIEVLLLIFFSSLKNCTINNILPEEIYAKIATKLKKEISSSALITKNSNWIFFVKFEILDFFVLNLIDSSILSIVNNFFLAFSFLPNFTIFFGFSYCLLNCVLRLFATDALEEKDPLFCQLSCHKTKL